MGVMGDEKLKLHCRKGVQQKKWNVETVKLPLHFRTEIPLYIIHNHDNVHVQ